MGRTFIPLLFVFILLMKKNIYSQIITESNYQAKGWEKNPSSSPKVNFVCGPNSSPAGKGSLELLTVAQTERVRFRTNLGDTIFLKNITELKYSTFIKANSNNNAPVITLQLDKDGKDTDSNGRFENDYNINFEPKSAGEVRLFEWQEWDALNGRWSFFLTGTGGGFVNPVTDTLISVTQVDNYLFSFSDFLQWDKLKDAVIMNTDATGTGTPAGGGIRFTAGGGNIPPLIPDEWANFNGNIDAFRLSANGRTPFLFDFEAMNCTSFVEQTICVDNLSFIGNSQRTAGSTYSWAWSSNMPPMKYDLTSQTGNPGIFILSEQATPPGQFINFILTETATEGRVFTTRYNVRIVQGVCPKLKEPLRDLFLKWLMRGIIGVLVFGLGFYFGRKWLRRRSG